MKPKYHSAKTILAPLNAMRERGISVGQALAGTGLSLSILNRPEQHVSLSQELGFLRNLRKVSKDPAIGLHVGACYPLSTFGLYGYALMSAPTMGEAIALAYQFVELSFAFYEHSFDLVGQSALMTMDSADYQESDIAMLSEREMMATLMILRGLLGDEFKLGKAHLKHEKMANVRIYEQAFDAPVEFNAPVNALEFDKQLLSKPLLQCDSETAALCIDRCERIKARLDEEVGVVDEVRELMLLRPGYFPDIETVAAQMHVSGRTLRRRLAQHGTHFQEILDTLRFDLAREYLSNTKISIEQISALLGYSDAAHFSHAFKRWAACSPSQFRGGTDDAWRISEGLSPVQRL